MIPPHHKPKKKVPASWEIFIDGASRGNPGNAGAGIYITDEKNVIVEKGFYLGERTNNQAEYIALVLALALVKNLQGSDVAARTPSLHIHSDSELLIKQMKGIYKVKNPELIKLKAIIHALLHDTTHSFKHVRRMYNHHADALANQGIDEKTKIPTNLIQIIKQHMPS